MSVLALYPERDPGKMFVLKMNANKRVSLAVIISIHNASVSNGAKDCVPPTMCTVHALLCRIEGPNMSIHGDRGKRERTERRLAFARLSLHNRP